MEIQKIEKTYGRSPQADALFDLMGKKSVHSIFLQGLLCSSAPMFFASLQGKMRRSVLFVLDDADEAGGRAFVPLALRTKYTDIVK